MANSKNSSKHQIVVVIDATKQITKHAIDWAISNVAHAGDTITLLAVIPASTSGWKFWLRLRGDCTQPGRIRSCDQTHTLESQINDYCSDMLMHLHKRCDAKKIKVKLKIIMAAAKGATAFEARKLLASWVILDRHMKKEAKYCMEQLQCNLVLISQNNSPKMLRFNLKQVLSTEESSVPENVESASVLLADISLSNIPKGFNDSNAEEKLVSENQVKPVDEKVFRPVAVSSGSPSTATTDNVKVPESVTSKKTNTHSPQDKAHAKESGVEKGTKFTDPTFSSPRNTSNWSSTKKSLFSSVQKIEQGHLSAPSSRHNSFKKRTTDSSVESALLEESAIALKLSVLSVADENKNNKQKFHNPMLFDILKSESRGQDSSEASPSANDAERSKASKSKYLSEQEQAQKGSNSEPYSELPSSLDRASSVRLAVSLERNPPSGPPPLCSICQHKSPIFGRPPIKFSYGELQKATKNFSEENFLAEGGFGPVHKGVLSDGQHIAVKQHRVSASTQGDKEFCSEVEVLNCAQHRNVVMLIGYCIENGRRLLVYEFVCNGSLDVHLFAKDKPPMEWKARRKVALGAARGLRFLHEDCRVGCIIHRDLRPNNILLTHDFEPLVGDFGLARWQADGELEEETRVIGTFGYLAPEYAQTGQVTEKADVYSFGVVLLELITGRKAIDFNSPKGQQCLTEWSRPIMDDHTAFELVDQQLGSRFSEYEAQCMLHAASLCIRRDPYSRPRMAQVLRILEGDMQAGSPTPYKGLSRSPDEFETSRSSSRAGSRLGSPNARANVSRSRASSTSPNQGYAEHKMANAIHENPNTKFSPPPVNQTGGRFAGIGRSTRTNFPASASTSTRKFVSPSFSPDAFSPGSDGFSPSGARDLSPAIRANYADISPSYYSRHSRQPSRERAPPPTTRETLPWSPDIPPLHPPPIARFHKAPFLTTQSALRSHRKMSRDNIWGSNEDLDI